MNNRIKQIREHENLSQDAFGKRIGSARNTIANYESGNRNPSNAVIMSICREFNVNEEWLRTGTGDPFNKQTINLSGFPQFNDLPPHKQKAIEELLTTYLELDDISQDAISVIAKKLSDARKDS